MKHFKKYPQSIKASANIQAAEGKSEAQVLKEICEILKSKGIDTTKHKYEMMAEAYDRFSSGGRYTVKFTCPGDYLAYFAMIGHSEVDTLAGLVNTIFSYMDLDENDLEGTMFYEEHGGGLPETLEDMKDYAESNWWGDGDDFIYYLKNLDTGEILYDGGEDGTEEYESDDEDWEDWED